MKLIKKSKTKPEVITRDKPQGKVETTRSTNLEEVVASGERQGTVRVVITARLSKNYNSVGVEVGGEIPFHLHHDDVAIETFSCKFEGFFAHMEEVAEKKIQEMYEVLPLDQPSPAARKG